MPSLSNPFKFEDVDPERRNAILLIGGIGVLIIFSIALIAYGYYDDRIASKGETVLKMGDQRFSYNYLEKRAVADVATGDFNRRDINQSIADLVAKIEREELVRVVAADQGITVSSEDIDTEIRHDLGLSDTAPREAVAEVLRPELQITGLSLGDYREIMETRALESKLRLQFAGGLPAEAEQIDLLIVQAPNQAVALQAQQSLDEGRDFATVAAQFSEHDSSTSGGGLGWIPRGLLQRELEEKAFALAAGERSEVFEAGSAFLILYARARETRAIDEATRQQMVDRQVDEKLLAAKEALSPEYLITVGHVQQLAERISRPNG
jgi:hypothetical protein